MPDEEDVIEEVNDLLASAIRDAQVYADHESTRPSAIRGFDKVQEAHEKLTRIDSTRSLPGDDA